MRFLFLKKSLNWPRATGHDIHAFHLSQALAKLGHAIGFATVDPPAEKALDGLPLDAGLHSLRGNSPSSIVSFSVWEGEAPAEPVQKARQEPRPPKPRHGPSIQLSYFQRRFLRYWGIEQSWIDATGVLVESVRPNVVVAAGLDLLPCLAAVHGPARIWYAADEYAWHHLSMLKLLRPRTWRHLVEALVAALYERAFARCYDRAWVVSGAEARAIRWIAGARAADVVTNGVDGDWFRPGNEPLTPHSCVFWGRLDAVPNIQALEWFCRKVWPNLRRSAPDARFSIYGFAPTAPVRALERDGVSVIADAPDIRSEVRKHQVAVMPFVSGGGIKNKLLEAAALGMPIVSTPQGCVGLDTRGGLPVAVARSPRQWVNAVANLWTDAEKRGKLGSEARAWVLARHTWSAAAQAALAGLQRGPS